jgi:hypothetical protein
LPDRGTDLDEFFNPVDDPIMFVSLFGNTDFYLVARVQPSFPRVIVRKRLARCLFPLQVPQRDVGSGNPQFPRGIVFGDFLARLRIH